MKKIFTSVLLGVFALSTNVFAFSDVGSGHMNHAAIDYAYVMGIIDGYPDGSFGPDLGINRAELMKIMVEMSVGTPDSALYRDCFPDVGDDWYAPYVCLAEENGWVDGYDDGYFRPGDYVNRAEALKIIVNILLNGEVPQMEGKCTWTGDLAIDMDGGSWYYPFFDYAVCKNIVDEQHYTYHGGGTYKYYPEDSMNRKEVVEMIYRYTVMNTYGLNAYDWNYSMEIEELDSEEDGLYMEAEADIETAFANRNADYSAEDVSVEISEMDGDYVFGMISFGGGGPGNGGWFYAVSVNGSWVVAQDGNGMPQCSVLDAYGFPADMQEGCFGELDEPQVYWQSYSDFRVDFPSDWKVVYEADDKVWFAPYDMFTDYLWGIDYSHDPSEMEDLIADIGDQFEDREEVRETIYIGEYEATKVTVTTGQYEDWEAVYVFVERNGDLYYLNNGAIPDERFVDFYESLIFYY